MGGVVISVPEVVQTLPFRGRRSRNKVSVGEPAEGSLLCLIPIKGFMLLFINKIIHINLLKFLLFTLPM